MLFWVSVSNYETGEFQGVAIVNRDTPAAAADSAVLMTGNPHKMEAAAIPIKQGGPPIPGGAIGRLMALTELERHFGAMAELRVFLPPAPAAADSETVH
jgi:hypothetical protein